MKKVLLGTSAIALAGAFVTQASANEWTVRVGGYSERHVVYADPDFDAGTGDTFDEEDGFTTSYNPGGDYDGIDVHPDTEVYVIPSITLDNGMQFGANVQIEGDSAGVDESYIFVDGSFGELVIGGENSAGYAMTYIAPDVTFVGVNSGSLPAFLPGGFGDDFGRMTLGSSTVETLGNSDIDRITYYTPRFAGFQVGVSYARDNTERSGVREDCDEEACDFFDVGANYVNSFGNMNVAVSGRYGWVNAESGGDPEVWAAGLNLGYGGFTVGGSYAHSDADHGDQEGEFWDAGVSYETGPWGFSFTYGQGENIDDEAYAAGFTSTEEELKQYLLGVNYTMAKGVRLLAFGGYLDFEEDNAGDGEYVGADNEAWLVGTSIRLDF